MGEGTGATMISLVCRAIAFADIIVKGRAGHLERTPGDFREGRQRGRDRKGALHHGRH